MKNSSAKEIRGKKELLKLMQTIVLHQAKVSTHKMASIFCSCHSEFESSYGFCIHKQKKDGSEIIEEKTDRKKIIKL